MDNSSHLNPDGHVPSDLEVLTRAYLESFEARDVERCVGFFAEDGFIDFQMSTYRGRAAIEQWHTDRFAADLKVQRVQSVRVDGDVVTVEAVVSSKRLAAWMIGSLTGRIAMRFETGKIKECRLALAS